MNTRTSFSSAETGQSIVEFALAAPFLILVTLGILDLGRLVFINTMLSAAVQEGARTGAVSTNFTQIQSSVENKLSGIDLEAVEITIDRTEAYAEVEVVYNFEPITPLIGLIIGDEGMILRRSARMQLIGVFFEP